MERATLQAMLEAAQGVERSGEDYRVAEGYTLAIYVGEPGQAMEVAQVARLTMHEAFCEAASEEHDTRYFLEYTSLHGFSVRPPSGNAGRRAGFS